MAKKQRLYLISVVIAGIWCTVFCAVQSVPHFYLMGSEAWIYCLLLFGLMVLCRMLPIYIGVGRAMDISFVPALAATVTSHYSIAAMLFLLSSLCSFLWDPELHSFYYPFARTPLKEAFNTANVVLAMTAVGAAIDFAGFSADMFASVKMMLLSIVFALAVIFLNFMLFLVYFYLEGGRRFATLVVKSIGTILPNILCTVPLGLIIGLLLQAPHGYLLVLLIMAPLLMARHSFKLYHDSHAMNMRTIAALCNAIDAKDHYTNGHSMRVAYFSRSIAEAMHMPQSFVEDVTKAALLHDVGKIGINDRVLTKPGNLTRAEQEEIHKHPVIGQKIIHSVHFSSTVCDGVLYHHLNFDRSGYPTENLPNELPLSAAILAVADTYDAMTSTRPYRPGMSEDLARELLHSAAGTQLHPEVVDVFLHILPELNPADVDSDLELQLELLT